MKQLMIFLLAGALVSFAACKGDDGAPGPAGVAGATGPAGTNGTNGTNGQDGNANVKSVTMNITGSSWTAVNTYENTAELNVAIITQDIADKGLVMVYLKSGALSLDATTWTALPFSLARQNYTESFAFATKVGKVILRETSTDGNPVEPAGSVRIVAATADGMMRYPDLDWTNYEEVKAALDLVE